MADSGVHQTRRIIEQCLDLGFIRAGVCAAAPSDHPEELRAWLASGKHAPMPWLKNHTDIRIDPNLFLPGARSFIIVADLYESRKKRTSHTPSPADPNLGKIARYARGNDYHTNIKKRLHSLCDTLRENHPAETFKAFCDTAPVLEREHAARAGLGWVGKHTLLINPRLGSYFFLAGIITSLPLTPLPERPPSPDRCGTCTRCIDACPTNAITPYSVDSSRCISALTIEERATIAPEFHDQMEGWVFGCDICQEVCPHNSPRPEHAAGGAAGGGPINEAYTSRRTGFDLLEILGWTESDRRDAFAKSSLKRAKLPMMKRNATIAAGNSLKTLENADLRSEITRLAADPEEDPMVRSTANSILESQTDP